MKPRIANKYRNIPTIVDGLQFHSKKEAARFGQLKLLQRAGKISDLRLQPTFAIVVAVRRFANTLRIFSTWKTAS